MSFVFVLNGTSSAGKTTLSRAIQAVSPRPFMHVQMDTFIEMLPAKLDNHPDAFVFRKVPDVTPVQTLVETGPTGEKLLSGMRGAVAAMADAGNHLVVDDVWMNAGEQQAYRDLLTQHEVRFVGVHATLEILEAREIARGDRDIGVARWLFPRVHQSTEYDLEVDTGELDPEAAARAIMNAFSL